MPTARAINLFLTAVTALGFTLPAAAAPSGSTSSSIDKKNDRGASSHKIAITKTTTGRTNAAKFGQTNNVSSKPDSVAKSSNRTNADGAQPSESGPKEDAWVLEQQNGQIGKMTIYAAQNAVRIRIGNTGGNIVAKAPDWKVTAFNLNDKTVYESSYEKFVKQELPSIIATSDYFEGRKNQKPEPVMYRGWKALQSTAPTPQGTVGMMMPTYSGVGDERSKTQSKSVTVITSEQSPASPQVMSIVKAIYRLPKFGGFPLGVLFTHGDGSVGVTLKTYSMKKQKIASSFFTSSTKGYERVKTAETALLYGLLDSSFMETP